MLYKLNLSQYSYVRRLLAPLNYNLNLLSLLDGVSPGEIYANDPDQPTATFVNMGHHLFLAGTPDCESFNQAIRRLLLNILIPRSKAIGHDIFMLHTESDTWNATAQAILEGMYPLDRMRQYFECSALHEDWRALLPEGFQIQPVDTHLTDQKQLTNSDYLLDELCSERPSVEDFLRHSFGFAITHENDLAAWCLSEYNTGDRCEVGIATVDEYQRRGFGRITGLALVEYALSHGYTRVGWHCWKLNVASSALALRIGFNHICDYPVYFCILNRAVQCAIHGNDTRQAGDLSTARAWYEKAIGYHADAWVYFEYARCLARLDQPKDALEALRQAIERGYDNHHAVSQEPDLASLHSLPDWNTILANQ